MDVYHVRQNSGEAFWIYIGNCKKNTDVLNTQLIEVSHISSFLACYFYLRLKDFIVNNLWLGTKRKSLLIGTGFTFFLGQPDDPIEIGFAAAIDEIKKGIYILYNDTKNSP